MSETEFAPTHCVPNLGMHAWAEPDPGANPVATLAPGTQLQLVEVRGAWANVAASNGWRGWVDSRQLVWGPVPPPPGLGVMAYQPQSGAPRGTNGFAVASLVLGILWIWWLGSVLALVFGYVARNQVKRTGEGGGGMALAGIILGWVAIGGLVVVAIVGATIEETSALVRHLPASG